jgi:disulfide bond formation protein DsbB
MASKAENKEMKTQKSENVKQFDAKLEALANEIKRYKSNFSRTTYLYLLVLGIIVLVLSFISNLENKIRILSIITIIFGLIMGVVHFYYMKQLSAQDKWFKHMLYSVIPLKSEKTLTDITMLGYKEKVKDISSKYLKIQMILEIVFLIIILLGWFLL